MSTGNVSYIEPAYCIVLIFISYRYTFNNGYVGNQLSFWIAKSKAKEAALSGEVNLNMREFLHNQQIKLINAAEKAMEAADPVTAEDESDHGDSEPEPEPIVLTRDDSAQQLRVGDLTIQVPAKTNINLTPIKQYAGKRVNWKDGMKVQFLGLYIDKAVDPLKRPTSDKPKSKAVYKEQIDEQGEIYNGTIMYMGEKTSLPSLCQPDTLHQFMGYKGLTGQKNWGHGLGLAAIIDYVMQGKEQSKAVLQEHKWEVMNLATQLSDDC